VKVYICIGGDRGIELVTLDKESAIEWLDLWEEFYDEDSRYFPIPLRINRSYQGGTLVTGFKSGAERFVVVGYDVGDV
jgi:hypothetical protein